MLRKVGVTRRGDGPKAEQYAWRCWATNSKGELLCQPGPDGLPKQIYGGSTAEAAADAHVRHMILMHPSPQQRAAMSVKHRRPVRTVQPRWSK